MRDTCDVTSAKAVDEQRDDISTMLSAVFPKRRIDSVRVLEGGKTNSNLLIRVEGWGDTFVFRRHLRGSEACRKERSLLKALQGRLPVPELIDANSSEDEPGAPYLVYRYVPGRTFREIRDAGSPQDMADAASAIGHCLSMLDNFEASLFSDSGVLQRSSFGYSDLDSPILRQRLQKSDWPLLEALHTEYSAALRELAIHDGLCHGDFNHRNIVLKNTTGTWEVAAILDWELAYMGSSLWDAARLMCYEKPDSKLWEDAFVAGLQASHPHVPIHWYDFSIALSTFSAARSLAKSSVQQSFVPELQMLIHAGLRGKRIH